MLAAKLRGAATILLIYDLYPDALEKAGLIKPSSLTARLIRVANRRLASRARMTHIASQIGRTICARSFTSIISAMP